MRHLFTAAVLCIAFATLGQQADQFNTMAYQAVVRNTAGEPVASQNIHVRFRLIFGLAIAYEETQQLTTNALGLLTAEIGAGTPTGSSIFPTYAAIDWQGAVANWSLDVAMDLTGGSNFESLGIPQQLRAVPFANLAQRAVVLGDSAWVPSMDAVVTDLRVGIGTANPTSDLHVQGSMTYEDGNAAEGRVLTSDALGNATWSPIALAYGESFKATDTQYFPNANWQAIGLSIALPAAGTYQLTATVRGEIGSQGSSTPWLTAALYDATTGTILPNSEFLVVHSVGAGHAGSADLVKYHTAAGPTTIEVRVNIPTSGQPVLVRSNIAGRTRLGYVRIGG